ncbi:MAG TPA: gamma-glutamylcyclotransferase [Candidatus Latescibacteria bacterium]|nr:gamma-glutamylcyclotransferase [Candidatus Latescibacterota bacterium]
MSTSAVHVFAYGSLMIPRVMDRVAGRLFVQEPAQLQGYARYALRGETYPGLVEEEGVATDGVLWRDIGDDDLQRLDTFEGEWYERRTVWVVVGADQVQAETYVLIRTQQHRVSRRSWSRNRFESRYLQNFLANYKGPDQ